jgi:hypothetical protein
LGPHRYNIKVQGYMAEDSEVTDLIGEPLTEEDSDFIKNLQELLKAGIAEPIDGAKQVITTNGLLLTVYFVAISFGKFKDMSYESGLLYGIQTCLFCVPILLFLLSTYYALRVYIPVSSYPSIYSPDLRTQTYKYIIDYRYSQLKRSILSMELGFVLMLVCFIVYMIFIPTSENVLKIDLINLN